jgi:hypothetical protein
MIQLYRMERALARIPFRQMGETFVSWSIMSNALGVIVEMIIRSH